MYRESSKKMDIEELKGLPILKAHFKELAKASKAACADLNLPSRTVGIVYWEEDDSWVVRYNWLEDSLRTVNSETKDRGYKIDALYFADKFEAKNYNDSISDLLHAALETYANPENKTGKDIEGKIVIELDMNEDPVYFLMEYNTWQYELTKEEFDSLWEYKIQTINIPEGTTAIEKKAFKDYTDLTSIVIPNSVTEIGEDAFSDCTGLTCIVIPDSVTEIGGGGWDASVFYGCTGLTSIVIGNSVTEIGQRTFYGCTGLTSITIPDSVKTIEMKGFGNCTSLASVTIEGPVEKIEEDAFCDCTSLKTITLPAGIKKVNKKAFEGCTAIERINVPAKKADYYKKRLPESLHAFIVEQ